MTRARRPALLAMLLAWGLTSEEAVAAPARISGAPLVYVRSGPGPDHQPVRILSEGDTVEKLEDLGSWTRIETPKGEIGFVYSSFVVEMGPPAANAAEPEAAAEAPIVTGQEPTPVAVPVAPELLPEQPPGPDEEAIAAEVSELRREIAELKSRLVERLPRPVPENPRSNPGGEEPPSRIADGSLQTLAAAVVSLLVGWFLGLLFARRRTRSQRSRLRF